MKCKIEVDMDNAAFEEDPNEELARVLEKGCESLRRGFTTILLHDICGNRVGQLVIED